LGEQPEQHAEAAALLEQLAAAWPDHPLHAEINLQRQRLANPA
jgi:hypothetical protein